jgi:hypothetical protein
MISSPLSSFVRWELLLSGAVGGGICKRRNVEGKERIVSRVKEKNLNKKEKFRIQEEFKRGKSFGIQKGGVVARAEASKCKQNEINKQQEVQNRISRTKTEKRKERKEKVFKAQGKNENKQTKQNKTKQKPS